MNPFTYRRATSADDALAAAGGGLDPATFLAGGTTLVDLMRLDVATPAALVDINALPFAAIEPLPGGGLRLGALAKNSDVARHDAVASRYPVLAEALLAGASPQIRNMATVGGNLLQRTRCVYFRNTDAACNKRTPGAGCAALGGYHRGHAVLGGSDRCFATFPGDMPVALAALDAVVRTRRAGGAERAIPAAQLHLSYGDDPARETVLEPGELIVAVDLPSVPWFARSTYVKVRDRSSYEFALAAAAVALDLDSGGRIRAARVALGGVATRPWRSPAAEAALLGATAGPPAFAAAAAAALAGAQPRPANAFKVELARRTVERALALAAGKRL